MLIVWSLEVINHSEIRNYEKKWILFTLADRTRGRKKVEIVELFIFDAINNGRFPLIILIIQSEKRCFCM